MYLSLVLAASTLKVVAAKVGDGDQSTDVTDMDAIRITDFKESFAEELCRTMRYLTVTFHLSKTKTAITETSYRHRQYNLWTMKALR